MSGPAWKRAYEWMTDELIAMGFQHHLTAPIWAWHSCNGWHLAPTQKTVEALFDWNGRTVFQLELEVRERDFVISDYGPWNEIIDMAFDCIRDQRPLVISEKDRAALFSIEAALATEFIENLTLQACLRELRWRQVCSIRKYTLPGIEQFVDQP